MALIATLFDTQHVSVSDGSESEDNAQNTNHEKVVSLPGLSGFSERLRQIPTEFLEKRAQGRGDGLGFAAGRRAGAGQVSLADLHRLISASTTEPPSRE